MNTARRITVNFLTLTASEIISKTLQLLVFIFLARALGKEDFGIFSFGLAFSLLIVIIADFGLSTLLIREISRKRQAASKYLSNAFYVKVFLALITIIATALFLNLMNYANEVKLIAYIMLTFTILQSFTDLYYSIFRSFERMHYDAMLKILRMVILVGLIFFAIRNNYGLIASSLAFPVTEALIFILAVSIAYKRFIRISFDFNYKFSKKLIKKSSLFCLSIVFMGLFTYIDTVMISKIEDTTEVGIYAAAANIIIALIFLPLMFSNAVFPVISRLYLSSKKSLKFAYERSFKYILILGLPVSVVIFLLSKEIILLLYGEEYVRASAVLAILSWYLFLRFLNVISGYTLSAINRQKSRVFSQGLTALINIGLNFILIPLYGIMGAAVATLITEIIFFFAYIFFVIKYGLKIRFISISSRPLLASAIMLIALSFIGDPILTVIAGVLIYITSLLALGTIDKEDKEVINKVARNI